MMMKRTRLLAATAAALLACTVKPGAAAFPDRPIQVVVPWGAGGPMDTMARILAPCMGGKLGQPVVIVNRAGANGDIGALAVRQARPDGHTLLFHASVLTIMVALDESPAMDVRRDFEPIMKVVTGIQGVYVPSAMPVTSLQEVIARVRANPGTLNYGSVGTGSVNHLAIEALSAAARLDMVHVTYAQSTPSMLRALMTNEIQLVMTDMSGAQSALDTGRIRLLALHARERLASRPEIPTLAEVVPDMAPFIGMLWYGYLAPAGTPAEIVERLHNTLAACLADPETRGGLRRLGYEDQQIVAQGPAEFRASFEPEIARLRELGRRGNIVLR
jgi:tripartite-type tricarboxylate transporter receptor subunit TctC